MATTASHLPLCRQRFKFLLATTLAIIVASLSSLVPTATAVSVFDNKSCVEIKEDYDLRNIARDNNVFIVVHEAGEENSAARQHICNKLEVTPEERLEEAAEKGHGRRPTVFAFLEVKESSYDTDGQLQDGGKNFARSSLGVASFPSFMFLSGGMHKASRYSDYINHYSGETADGFDMSDLEKFIHKYTGFYLGNDVYNIIFFDIIASKFVSYGDAHGLNRLKQRGLALLVRFSTLFSYKEPFNSIGKLYNRAFAMSLEHGMDYAKDQTKRLEKKIESNQNNVSKSKLHELQQKMAILKSFSEPRELSDEDVRQIYTHSLLHVGLIVATILLFILPGDSEQSAEKVEEGEVINAIPVVAKIVDDDEYDENATKKAK
eukprot:CAMPEP_0171333680 /NCGR_PEP_ID=MMETSP0878-20121228/4152_1 /TAXON_ID=67004 /ORGANISM="Thalassiosira weissflogii, Strain CCMP1336" /LENGTH=375 /DNA_ID=CAMNT_0011834645 /DNA_START=43 /DNA_END=1170 /DNA_ORIENTATION=-